VEFKSVIAIRAHADNMVGEGSTQGTAMRRYVIIFILVMPEHNTDPRLAG
jgi:hypothetical protein